MTWRERYGPWALVTGASDGIGRALALDLAARGLNLVLASRRAAVLDVPVETRVIQVDLATPGGPAALIEQTADLDIGLVAAAAGFGTSGNFLDTDLDAELGMLEVNCGAVLEITHHFAKRLAGRGQGGMILMGSLLGFQGVPRAAHYAATKAYIQTLAEGLSLELKPRGVDVLASAPGPVHTGFAARANMRMSMGLEPAAIATATLNALGRKTTVRPGWLSLALELSLATLPRWARSRILAQVMAGMTRHQNANESWQRTPNPGPGSPGARNPSARNPSARNQGAKT
jgi:short-subunit dehydrogenase